MQLMKNFCRAFCLSVSCLIVLLGSGPARADVTGEGDVSPEFPDLPLAGGTVSGVVTVGGTGSQIGGTDFGILTIDIPAFTDPLVSDGGIIGGTFDGFGRAVIAGTNSQWSYGDRIEVGQEGQGFLEVLSGALVLSGANDGMVFNGGSTTDPDFTIGTFEGSQGFVTVDGIGSLIRSNFLGVGHGGSGRLEISGSARVQTDDEAIIGNEVVSGGISGTPTLPGNGSVFVRGRGTRWNIGPSGNTGTTGDLTVGNEGRALLDVRDEALVRVVDDAFFGVDAGSYGEMVISDRGTLVWILDDAEIGNLSEPTARSDVYVENNGTFRVDGAFGVGGGGRINLAGGTVLTPTITNTGVIRGDGRIEAAILNAGGDIRTAAGVANIRERMLVTGAVTNSGIIESIGGEMEFESAVTNNADGQIFGKDAVLRFRGGLTDNGDMVISNTVVEAPILSVGSLTVGPESSFVLGDLAMNSASVLNMGIDDDDDHSRLEVTGDVTLAGRLTLDFDSGYNPAEGDSFEILAASSVTGTFDIEPLSNDPNFSFAVVYEPDAVFINILAGNSALPGDFDGDSDVDGDDLPLWEAGYGTEPGATPGDGDADADGDVDGLDFLTWQRVASGGTAATPAVNAIPEPSSLLLVTGLLAGLGLRRQR